MKINQPSTKAFEKFKIGTIAFLIFSCLFLFYIFYQSLGESQTRELSSTLINQPAPRFIKTEFFTRHKIDSNILFHNKNQSFTLLNVFASWCISCKDEHGLLMKLKRDGQLQIVGLNYKDSKEDARLFLKQLGNPYHYVFADQGEIGFDYGVYAVPETFLIDNQGIIRYKLVGTLTEQIIKESIIPLLKI